MSHEELEYTKKYLQQMRPGDMVKPLRLALIISPVILLSTWLLHNTRYDKQDLVQVSLSIILPPFSVAHDGFRSMRKSLETTNRNY
jgi:hypothetical protein